MKAEKLFCLSLETGAIAIAAVQMVLCSISFLVSFILFQRREELIDILTNSTLKPENLENPIDREDISIYVDAFLLIVMAACVINISTDISMIFGTIKRKHYFLLPWLSVFGFWICLLILQTAVLTCLKIYVLCTGKLGEAGNVGTTLLLLVIIGSFYIYLWVCVKSLYIRVKSLNNPPTWNEKVLEPVK